MKQYFLGLKDYNRARKIIKEHQLMKYLIIPGFFSMLYFPFVFFMTFAYFSGTVEYIHTNWLPDFMQWPIMAVFIAMVLWLISIIVCFLLYKFVILILYSPLAGYLSEKTEQAIGGEAPPPFNLRLLVQDVIRGIVLNSITLTLSLVLMFFAWLLVFIPLLGAVISPVLLFLIQAYFTGAALIDFTLERKRFTVSDSLTYAWKQKGRVSGIGTGFLILMFIPFIGWFLAPGYGVIAGTLGCLDRMKETGQGAGEAL